MIHERLYSFLLQYNAIYESQFGFQRGKSILHSLIEIVEKIRSIMEKTMDMAYLLT